MDAIGVDLSKNHYGICHVEKNGKINFIYSYFKPFLKRDQKTHQNETIIKVIETEVENSEFSFKKILYKYNDILYNQIECDALKSRTNIKSLIDFIESVTSNGKMIILEDYVMDGTKIVQLVHVTESFKYKITSIKCNSSMILF